MANQLPIKKIYIDSAHKVSGTDSNFKCELKETMLMPENAVFRIVDVAIPNTFTTIMSGVNDKLYWYVSNTNPVDSRPQTGFITTLTEKNYSGTEFATELQTKMRASHGTTNFSVVFNVFNQNITISTDVSNMTFKILTRDDLHTKLGGIWPGGLDNTPPDYDATNPQSVNIDLLKRNTGNSELFTHTTPYTSVFLNLVPIRNLYLSSNISNYNTADLLGRRNIIKKIPVNSGFGSMIFDSLSQGDDYLDCSRQTIQTINFKLTDTHDNIVPLEGYMSFSILFDILN